MSGESIGPSALRAWIDESGSDHRLDPGTYILAAALTDVEREDERFQ